MPVAAENAAGIDSPRAWLVVVAGFFACAIAYGVSYAFGVFLKPLEAAFGVNHATLSTLFSALTVLSYFLGPITGQLADKIGPRPMVAIAAVLMSGGLLLSARMHWFAPLYLTFGVCVGAAVACSYVTSVAAVGEWFKVQRDMALGIAITGTGLGTLIGAPAAARLIDRFGWRETLEVFGWVSLVGLLACAALLLRPPLPRKQDSMIWEKVRTLSFLLLYLGLGFRGIALYATIVFLPAFAMDLGASHLAAARLIGYIGVASIAGRFGLTALSRRFGLMNTYLFSTAVMLAGCITWVFSHGYIALVVFALAMGVGYGANAAMTPSVVASKFGIAGLGRLLGWVYTSFGVACMVGPPLAGHMIDVTHDYRYSAYVALVGAIGSMAAIVPLHEARPQVETATAD
ncbi:MAG: MFS transporter [Candidatus Korobacteraceae bacterium]